MKCLTEKSACCTTHHGGSRDELFNLEGDDLAIFQRIKIPLLYKANQVVFYEGHASVGLYMLCAGKVKLTRSSTKGQRLIIGILDAGDIIEKDAFGDDAIHQVTCETLEPCKICLIERKPYLELIKRNGGLAIKLIELLSAEVRSYIKQLDDFTFKSARERLAAMLLELAQRFGCRDDAGVSIGMSLKREELAEMTGITPETLARLLSTFQVEKLLTVNRRTITLTNITRLSHIARSHYADLLVS
ncbi:MAG: Crp/Fnr family transcriptional regulator [Nitrospira sp.]|nr:Crp/Fnr family transcriptional regulator [Nitrospira sp.]